MCENMSVNHTSGQNHCLSETSPQIIFSLLHIPVNNVLNANHNYHKAFLSDSTGCVNTESSVVNSCNTRQPTEKDGVKEVENKTNHICCERSYLNGYFHSRNGVWITANFDPSFCLIYILFFPY